MVAYPFKGNVGETHLRMASALPMLGCRPLRMQPGACPKDHVGTFPKLGFRASGLRV